MPHPRPMSATVPKSIDGTKFEKNGRDGEYKRGREDY